MSFLENQTKLWLSAIALFASGCASIDVPPAPDTQLTDPALTSFENVFEETAPVTPRWWTQFDDPAMIALIERALKENRSLEAARANLAAANALVRRAELGRSFDTATVGAADIGTSNRESSINTSLNGGLSSTWEIDLIGRIDAEILAARLNREAVRQSRLDLAVAIAAQTAQAYVDLRGAQQRLDVAESSAELQAESLSLLQELVDAGRSNDLDLNRAEALYLTTRASLPRFRADVQTSKAQLSALAAISAGDERALFATLKASGDIPRHPGLLGTGTPSELIRRRPDIRAAEARISEQLSLGDIERSRLFPRLTFNADLNAFFGGINNLGDANRLGLGIGPGLSWDGPDLRRVRADIDLSDALTREAIATYEQVVFEALSEVESALALYGRELERREDLIKAVAASETSLRLARLRFEEGLDDFLDVLDAQRVLLDARDSRVQNDIFITTFAISAYRALGGMWTQSELEHLPSPAQAAPVQIAAPDANLKSKTP